MEALLLKVESIVNNKQFNFDINQEKLEEFGLSGAHLRDYQLIGVNWLIEKYKLNTGCILADEMGLGKTLQTISFLIYIYGSKIEKRKSLIVAPLSVINNWKSEFASFAPNLNYIYYNGNMEERKNLTYQIKSHKNLQIIITTYEICLNDKEFLHSIDWFVLIVDEAHRLKNQMSLLHLTLINFNIEYKILLTGTPIQNNLDELYSLLSFCNPNIFSLHILDQFVSTYKNNTLNNSDLMGLINAFILRRVKCDVVKDLPTKSEVILYHGMSALQKKYYKAILVRDLDVFKSENKTRLLFILMQLRKCVCHPYLFEGVEPEPFEMGDHLIKASGKLVVLDQLLKFLKINGHKVLIFSQMTRHLDVLQDYLSYKDYTYERLDGSIRAEERYFSISRFNDEAANVFAFLLSTKAGGQGLNLTQADTVLIVDSDFNPQNDLQAAARAHRIGQKRNVKVIRFVCCDSVEELILKRAQDKLKLSHQVMSHNGSNDNENITSFMLSDMLKFGLDKLLSNTQADNYENIDFEKILGKTINGEWLNEDMVNETMKTIDESLKANDNMYSFDGHDYSKSKTTKQDEEALAMLFEELRDDTTNENDNDGRLLRKKNINLIGFDLNEIKSRQKKSLTPEELEERRKKRIEKKEALAKLMEENKLNKTIEKQEKKLQKWKKNNYTSSLLNDEYGKDVSGSEDDESQLNNDIQQVGSNDDAQVNNDDNTKLPTGSNNDNILNDENYDFEIDQLDEDTTIKYLIGDVTKPVKSKYQKNIILHCVDNSGNWGAGGVFRSIDKRSMLPANQYSLAAEMKDLNFGDVHLIEIENDDQNQSNDEISHNIDYIALLVVQNRNRKNVISQIYSQALERAFIIISRFALKNKTSVHLPRIGERSPGGDWYATERLVRKHFAAQKIPTFIYYYQRNSQKRHINSIHNQISKEPTPPIKKFKLPDFLEGKVFYFKGSFNETLEHLKRQIIAFGGELDDMVSDKTTHIVVDDDTNDQSLQFEMVKVIPIKELKTCLLNKFLK